MLLVFDERRPIDMTGMRNDPIFGHAQVELLPGGTLIHLPLPAGMRLALSNQPQGWLIAATPDTTPPQPIVPQFATESVRLQVTDPGQVVTLADPQTGATLLAGTQRRGGQAFIARRGNAQFVLLPTLLGIAVEPLADNIGLRVAPDGFALIAQPGRLAVSTAVPDALTDAAFLTRRFAFPVQPTPVLAERLRAEIAAAAAAPTLARGPRRRAAATTMIALGMAAEAQALLQVALADDPREAESTEIAGLGAIAALLAGRPQEATGIDDPRLTGTDEIVLWRGLRSAMNDATVPLSGELFASTASLVFTYPDAMRDRLLPILAETMIKAGEIDAAQALLARADQNPDLALARAMLKDAQGDAKAALTLYDQVAHGRDQLGRARAAMRATELRLAIGQIDTRHAAEALDRLLYVWRGDHRELALRERLAELRQQAGEWRAALALLRETEALFPDDKAEIHARMLAVFSSLLREDAADRLAPLEFVSLVDENADLLPNPPEDAALEVKLADRLLALDLPKRAGPVLEKLAHGAQAGPGRAVLGARLAALRLREDDAGGALAALGSSAASGLPDDLTEQRAILTAQALARRGDTAGAIAAVAGLDSTAALDTRARVLEQAKDWAGADRALADYVAKVVPDSGALTDVQRDVLLRLATAAARAGDSATLATLHVRDDQRIGEGAVGDMFRLLTADPVRSPADLARAGREIGLARALPAALKSLQPETRTP